MSHLIGTITGGLVAGAVYYSFSHSFEVKTRRLQLDLHELAVELDAPRVPTITPAARKIAYSPFREMLKEQWNQEVSHAVQFVGRYEIPWRSTWGRAMERIKASSA